MQQFESMCHDCMPSAEGIEKFPEGASDAGTDTVHAANTTHTTDATNDTDPTDAANDADPIDADNNADSADADNDTDPADATDADLLEVLANDHSATNPEQDHPVEVQSPAPSPIEQQPPTPLPTHSTLPDADSLDAPPQLVVDRFPQGSPGAPIPGEHQGSSVYHTSRVAFGASVWAPFHSQCDWEFAYWAKMRGVTYEPPPTNDACVGALRDLEPLQDELTSEDIHYWTHGEDEEDEATVRAMIEAAEEPEEAFKQRLHCGSAYVEEILDD